MRPLKSGSYFEVIAETSRFPLPLQIAQQRLGRRAPQSGAIFRSLIEARVKGLAFVYLATQARLNLRS